jgi:hypothetical protein
MRGPRHSEASQLGVPSRRAPAPRPWVEEEEEDLFVFNDTVEVPGRVDDTRSVKPGRETQA